MMETATAHGIAGRWQAAYDICSEALTLPRDEPKLRARFYRGQGFSLIEMHRLDLPEAAYREALKLEPDDASAQRELA